MPLERDEGEYAYIGQLLLDGDLPYTTAYSMKLPGIFFVYAGIMSLLGHTAAGIRAGLTIIVSISTLLLFFLARRLMDDAGAVVASTSFALLSVGDSILGLTANAEHFVLPAMLGAFLLLLIGIERDRKASFFFISGMLFGVAFLVKQHALFFCAFGAILLLSYFRPRPLRPQWLLDKRFLGFSLGMSFPFLAICAIYASRGIFKNLWFWAFVYPRTYILQASADDGLALLFFNGSQIIKAAPLLWIAAALGFVFTCFWPNQENPRRIIIGFLAASVLTITPGFYFRPHYFLLIIPSVALLIGALDTRIKEVLSSFRMKGAFNQISRAFLWIALFGLTVAPQAGFFFRADTTEALWRLYGPYPTSFAASRAIADHIRPILTGSKRIAVIGSEPQIYFYLNTKAPTGYVYVYFITEDQPFASAMQAEFTHDIEFSLPDYLIYAPSWKDENTSKAAYDKLWQWYDDLIKREYELIGLANILSPAEPSIDGTRKPSNIMGGLDTL